MKIDIRERILKRERQVFRHLISFDRLFIEKKKKKKFNFHPHEKF